MTEFDFAPTHRVPEAGLPARVEPRPDAATAGFLDPWLDVQVVERDGSWARIVCANTWSAWVHADGLIPRDPPPEAPARVTVFNAIGIGLAILATVMPWVRPPPAAAWRIPVAVLFDSGGLEGGGMTLGLMVAIVAIGVGGAAIATASPFASRLAGGVLLGIAGVFLARAFSSSGSGALRLLGTGPFLLILAGLVFVVAPDMKPRSAATG